MSDEELTSPIEKSGFCPQVLEGDFPALGMSCFVFLRLCQSGSKDVIQDGGLTRALSAPTSKGIDD